MIKNVFIFVSLFCIHGITFADNYEKNIREMFKASKDEIALSDFLDRKFNPPYESYELSLYYLNKCQTSYLTPYQLQLMRPLIIQEAIALPAPSIMAGIERGEFLSIDILQSNLFHLTGSLRKLLNPSVEEELSADKLGGLLFRNDKPDNQSNKLKEEFKKGAHFKNLFSFCFGLDFMVGLVGSPSSITKEIFDDVSNEISLGAKRIRDEKINNLLNN
jgi:hypothetical protein